MHTYVFIETEQGQPRSSSQSALAYAVALAKEYKTSPKALIVGPVQDCELLSQYGIEEVICIGTASDQHPQAQAAALSAALPDEALTLVMSHQVGNDQIAAHLSIIAQSALATGVMTLPKEQEEGCLVERSIYTGKAFEEVLLSGPRRILCVRKSAVTLQPQAASTPKQTSLAFNYSSEQVLEYLGEQKSRQQVPLPEAEIVISGGRGMKDPQNWSIIEEIAELLGAATACSKPVSDMSWRPHHEHVGQTGIKIAPQLYIAVGISGAVQHIAGISNSKYIVVINNDSEAPFFQIANYGIVGDALEVLPKLKASLQKLL